MKKKLDILYFNIIYIIFIELIFKIFTLKDLFSFNTLYVIAFSIPTAIILTLLETMFKNEKIIWENNSVSPNFFFKWGWLIYE